MPSLLSADFANLQSAIESVPSSDALHVDVMDNHFVPNLTLGLPVVESIRKVTDQLLDIHLMIEDPDRWAPAYAEAGAESVTFHVEAARPRSGSPANCASGAPGPRWRSSRRPRSSRTPTCCPSWTWC
jgi:ribulose-phosphate 3-epimerase